MTSLPHYIGIDPGQSGGLVVLSHRGDIVLKSPMPDLPALCALLEGNWPTHVFVEQVSSRPGQGIASTFKFGSHYGSILGILTALDIAHTLLTPQKWQKLSVVGCIGDDPKAKALIAAQRLWPKEDWKASARCKRPHDGMIDAALIALAGMRLIQCETKKETA